MKQKKFLSAVSILLSLLLLISVINIPAMPVKAADPEEEIDTFDTGKTAVYEEDITAFDTDETVVPTATGIEDFVKRCYKVTVGRNPDKNGYKNWTTKLSNNEVCGAYVAYCFIFGKEYKKLKKSNSQFVDDLYILFLGRKGDASGKSAWVKLLKNGMSREQVFAGFANSPEFYKLCKKSKITAGYWEAGTDPAQLNNVNMFVARLYRVTLKRIGDMDGQAAWTKKLVAKETTGSQIAHDFIFSDEYVNKNLSDSKYIKNLYLAIMGREYDYAGYKTWLNKFADGWSRDQVFENFTNAPEFEQICKDYGIAKGVYVASDISWTPETEAIYQRMIAMKAQYPEGMHWTNANTYRGGGCVAFANIISDAAFGKNAPFKSIFHPTYDDIRVGDMIRMNNNTHTVIVLRKYNDRIQIAEGNYNSSIHWGRIISKEYLLQQGNMNFITTRYGDR